MTENSDMPEFCHREPMKEYSNYDLHLMLLEMNFHLKALIKKADATISWQKDHEKKDEVRFRSLERFGKSIAIVSAFISAVVTYILMGSKS